MNVASGSRLTPVGAIPTTWHVVSLDSCVRPEAPICYGILMPGSYCHGGVPVVKVRDIIDGQIEESGLLLTHPSIDEAYRRSRLSSGDVLITIRGTTGRVAIVSASLDGANITQDTARLRVRDSIDSQFLYFLLQSDLVQSQVALHTVGQAVRGINIRDVRDLALVLPESLVEQRAIAAVLRDIDALIDALDRLIAKKRDLMLAAMQQLLSGSVRLPGFSAEWCVKQLGARFDFSGGLSASRGQLSQAGHCYLHYGDVHGATRSFIDVAAEFPDIPKLDIELDRVASGALLRDGDIVFVDASEDVEGASKHVVVVNSTGLPFISGLHTIVAKPKTSDLVREFARYCFQTEAIRDQFEFYAVGTKVTGISKANIAKLVLSFPSRDEQTTIAAVLSDMDAEIAAIEARREKTKALKQGMMQELLTGRTRLVTPSDDPAAA